MINLFLGAIFLIIIMTTPTLSIFATVWLWLFVAMYLWAGIVVISKRFDKSK